MNVFLIVVAFIVGAVYGYSVRAEHCFKHHHVHEDEETPRFKGPF